MRATFGLTKGDLGLRSTCFCIRVGVGMGTWRSIGSYKQIRKARASSNGPSNREDRHPQGHPDSSLSGDVPIWYIVPRTHYLGNWSPRA